MKRVKKNNRFNEDQLKIQLEGMKHQIDRLVSNAESEKETSRRMNNLLMEKIDKVDSGFKDVFYGVDRKSGLIVEVYGLLQGVRNVNRNWKIIIGLCVAVLVLILDKLVKL